ncbi:unnamed protein product, partial [Aureobasidium pullulans]
YLASYIPAIKSIIPQSSPSVAALPEVGEQAPAKVGSVDLKSGGGRPTLLAFVRHCGCPFAEKEVQLLGAESRKNEKLHVVIVQHSDEATTQQCGKKAFPDSKRYTLIADPERKAYAAWGVGSLGWGGMVNGGVMEALKSLKESDGIDLRPTGVGSYRWQNSGGFAVDSAGTIRWRKIANDSSDMCDYSEAAKTITEGKDRQYAIKRLAVLSFERCLDPTNPLVRTRSLKTRELIPEDVKFFNSTVNASTAIVRGYICLRLLAYSRKRKIL